jgi:hypothetical protein
VRAAAVSLGVRAAAIPRASGAGAPRQVTDDDALMARGQASTMLPNRTSGASHPRAGGDGGCARRGRLRQQRRLILEEHTRRRILEAHAPEWRQLASPLPRRRRPSLGASDGDGLPYAAIRVTAEIPVLRSLWLGLSGPIGQRGYVSSIVLNRDPSGTPSMVLAWLGDVPSY